MDDVIVRPRYQRQNLPGRRRKKNTVEKGNLMMTVARQLLICIMILVVIIAVNSINTSATNYLSGKIKSVLFNDIDLKNISQVIGNVYNRMINRSDADFNNEALPAGAGFNTSDNEAGEHIDTTSNTYNRDSSVSSVSMDDIIRDIRMKYTFLEPVNGSLSSPYGERLNPFTKTTIMHNGIDIEVDGKTPVKASLDGVISETGSEKTYGSYIKILHDDGIVTVYAYCSQLLAGKGQEVKQGDIIAEVGDTGASVGSHLHFEIWKNGIALDPLSFIDIQ